MKNSFLKRTIFKSAGLMLVCSIASANTHVKQQNDFVESLKKKNTTELDQVPSLLPAEFLANFIVKHGLNHDGSRGHKHEEDIPGFGIHAEVTKPRIYVFNPNSGMAISYNGDKGQQGGESLDVMTYEEESKSFDFRKIDFPIQKGNYALSNESCTLCHGGAAKNEKPRPIFSMYPDWPRFFGSDNDELLLGFRYPTPDSIPAKTDKVTRERIKMQHIEYEAFIDFKYNIAPNHARYAPLFSDQAYNVHKYPETQDEYKEYPYRSDVELIGEKLNPSDVSRAFARRAGLRFNLLYSRLNVRQVVNHIVSQKDQFKKFGKFFIYNTMRCGPELSDNKVIKKWTPSLLAALQTVEANKSIEYKVWDAEGALKGNPLKDMGTFKLRDGKLTLIGKKQAMMQYGENLALFGLKINDVDMRYTYYHKEYLPEYAYKNLEPIDAMQVGYMDMCGDASNKCEKYFNAYNDGSTTMDEHLTANLLFEIAKTDKVIAKFMKDNSAAVYRGLLDKYGGPTFKERLKLDGPFFKKMDSLSKWFSLPYPFQKGDAGQPTKFIEMHHRAPFNSTYQANYKAMCQILEKDLLK